MAGQVTNCRACAQRTLRRSACPAFCWVGPCASVESATCTGNVGAGPLIGSEHTGRKDGPAHASPGGATVGKRAEATIQGRNIQVTIGTRRGRLAGTAQAAGQMRRHGGRATPPSSRQGTHRGGDPRLVGGLLLRGGGPCLSGPSRRSGCSHSSQHGLGLLLLLMAQGGGVRAGVHRGVGNWGICGHGRQDGCGAGGQRGLCHP